MPKVSVIVPVYGVEKYLREALDSLINQTLDDIEIILLDDGGKDSCPQIIDEYASKDNRIIAIHKENGGYGHTCNVGLERASGEYIAILEPDDYIEPEMYEDLYNLAKENDADIAKSSFYENLEIEKKSFIQKINWEDEKIPNGVFNLKDCRLFLYYHPSIWSAIYKKSFLDKHNIRFVEAPGSGWTDNPFQVQTMCLAERIVYTPKAYYYWRKLNLYESDDLKDYTLPFKRSDEIHAWLEENNLNDNMILVSLARRELAYIGIVLDKKNILKNKDCVERIFKMLDRIPQKEFLESKEIKNSEKKFLKSLQKNLSVVYYMKYLRKMRKNIISIIWNRKLKRICLFGNVWRFS